MGFRKRISFACIAILTTMSAASQNSGQDAAKKPETSAAQSLPQVKCPVTGKPANLAASTPTKDGPIFFCSRECIEIFKADQTKYSVAVGEQRKVLAQRPRIQVKCPVSGDPPDAKIFVEKDGQKVAFCSEECRKKYASEPLRYASALANSYTFQVTCPVMLLPINPASLVKLPSGETVYFCCKGCDEKLLADPAKYAPALQEQGYSFDFKNVKQEQK